MQEPAEFRTNRDLFSNHYLDEHLPRTDSWQSVDSPELQEAYDDIIDLWERERDRVADRNESQLEEKFIRPMFRKLGIPFEVEESVEQGQRRPDYGFFQSKEAADNAFDRRREGGDFYKNAVAVADAKRWGRKLDTRGERQRDFENPSYQIHVYLQETPTTWAVLTNGRYWRLYYGPTSHRLDSYYEIDLPAVLESGDLEVFKYFYLFFRHEAFLPDASGDSFLDDVYSESNVFAEELGEDLQDNIYDAIQNLAEGFLTYPENDLGTDDLELIHDSSLIYLYRLIFVLYAESEGRDLLNTDNEIYEQSYSLNTIKQEVAEELDSDQPRYQSWQDNLWDRIDELFQLIDQGSASRGIPESDLHVPAYNGGLFRTNPDADDSREARFLATYTVGDAYLARVIELLTRSRTGTSGKIFVDYSSLDVRHLGSIYEGLLEYQLNVADEPLTLGDGEYVLADEGDEVVVDPNEVYLTTDSGERKATGSYYTPEYVVEYIVENTLDPLVEDIREDLVGFDAYEDEGGFAEEFADRVFGLKILDPAMGSGHFLTNAIDYLAREIIDAQERQAEQQGIETVDQGQDINWARRQVAQHCIYGVDLNPLAVELAKVSLWLRTLAAEQPLAFLDHHLKTGNSLVGSDIESIDELETDANNGPNASLADFGAVRRGTIDHLMDVYEEFIAIENTDLDDAKEMERKYRKIERDDLRTRLVAMANVQTAEDFDLDIPSGAYERMAAALDSEEEWAEVEEKDWFRSAQAMAAERNLLHWKLEFPEVFYEVDGTDRENPGFDAIIGNPPWMDFQRISDTERKYQRKKYHSAMEKYDLFVAFVEQGLKLLRNVGQFGYIIQNKFLSSSYGKGLKQYLAENAGVRAILDFEDAGIFRDTTTYPLILIASGSDSDLFDYIHMNNAAPEDVESCLLNPEGQTTQLSTDLLEPNRAWIFATQSEQQVIERLRSGQTIEVSEISEDISTGIKTNLKEAYVFDSEQSDIPVEQELLRPVLDGADISRYSTTDVEKYIIYPYERSSDGSLSPIELTKYPRVTQHFEMHKQGLKERLFYEKTIEEMGKRWYEYPYASENLLKPKLIFPDISTEPRCTFDVKGDTLILNTAYGVVLADNVELDVRYICSLFNSAPIRFAFETLSPKLSGGYFRFQTQYVGQLPVRRVSFDTTEQEKASLLDELEKLYSGLLNDTSTPKILEIVEECLSNTPERTDVIHDLLATLAENMMGLGSQRNELNLSLPDYLGNYEDGPTLGEFYQPPAGLADSILTDTTEERANLRVGEVTVDDDGGKLVVWTTARYKPDNPEEYETDRWGYTETDPLPAMEFVGLSDAERALIRAFVPHAAAEAGGFAGFRETATKTNSLVDRLEALTLPELPDVEDGLERYQTKKERAEELDEKIVKTDELIDQIVYRLYGLTDEEIEIVEEAVGDD